MTDSKFLHDIRVFDQYGHHVIGHLVAVDDDGLSMLSDLALDSETELSFMLEDVTDVSGKGKALFSATCDVCLPEEGMLDLYHVRLNFTHLSPLAQTVAKALH